MDPIKSNALHEALLSLCLLFQLFSYLHTSMHHCDQKMTKSTWSLKQFDPVKLETYLVQLFRPLQIEDETVISCQCEVKTLDSRSLICCLEAIFILFLQTCRGCLDHKFISVFQITNIFKPVRALLVIGCIRKIIYKCKNHTDTCCDGEVVTKM